MTPDDIKAARQWQCKFDILLNDYQEYGLNDDLAEEIFEAACHVKDYLTMALKELEAERAQCCKDVCFTCRIGVLKVIKWFNGNYVHTDNDNNVVCSCAANNIRQRAAREQVG